MFSERTKKLHIQNQLPHRQLAAILDIDTATYCKIGTGERRAKREQVERIAQVLNTGKEELITFWIADKVCQLVKEENNDSQILNNH